jgi:hypothetical protein
MRVAISLTDFLRTYVPLGREGAPNSLNSFHSIIKKTKYHLVEISLSHLYRYLRRPNIFENEEENEKEESSSQ